MNSLQASSTVYTNETLSKPLKISTLQEPSTTIFPPGQLAFTTLLNERIALLAQPTPVAITVPKQTITKSQSTRAIILLEGQEEKNDKLLVVSPSGFDSEAVASTNDTVVIASVAFAMMRQQKDPQQSPQTPCQTAKQEDLFFI